MLLFNTSESIDGIELSSQTVDSVHVRFTALGRAGDRCADVIGGARSGYAVDDRCTQPVFQHHVVDRRKSQACTQNVFNGRSLPVQGVYDRCTFRHQRSLFITR